MGTLCSLYLYTCITVSVIMAHEVGHIRVVRIRKLKLPRNLEMNVRVAETFSAGHNSSLMCAYGSSFIVLHFCNSLIVL